MGYHIPDNLKEKRPCLTWEFTGLAHIAPDKAFFDTLAEVITSNANNPKAFLHVLCMSCPESCPCRKYRDEKGEAAQEIKRRALAECSGVVTKALRRGRGDHIGLTATILREDRGGSIFRAKVRPVLEACENNSFCVDGWDVKNPNGLVPCPECAKGRNRAASLS